MRGTVKDVTAADRVMAIASTLGKTVNLLRVDVPPVEPQVLLKVRFANVDRGASTDLRRQHSLRRAFNQSTAISTGQFALARRDTNGTVSLSDALNILLFRPDINLAAAIKALEGKRLLETLAEPNLLAINGKQASFVAGGEFPFPMVQPGQGGGAISITCREFGIRIAFPADGHAARHDPAAGCAGSQLARLRQRRHRAGRTRSRHCRTRRVQTEVELESGQSFVIAGLLDNRMTRNLSTRSRALASIPVLGKLFPANRAPREQFRTAGDHHAGSGAADSGRPAAARR